MWIFLNNAMLSITDDHNDARRLLVRARLSGDIEAVFAQAVVTETPDADYRFRASIGRDEVAQALARAAQGIDYDNLRGSIADRARHAAYTHVWSIMAHTQAEALQTDANPRSHAYRDV